MIGDCALVEMNVAGRRLEIRCFAGSSDAAPIVMLHEGLGSVSAWRDFPVRLSEHTRRTVIAYSRYGYGRSERLSEPHAVTYMHHEAEVVLPALIAALELPPPVLFGHSDGASIALIFAGAYPAAAQALVLEAPHVFVEPLTVASIAHVKATIGKTGLIEKLARHHDDAASTFWGWNDIWLHPPFADWNITASLRSISAPLLLVQSRDDEYGTLAQLDAIVEAAPHAETLVLETGGHSPHRTWPGEVLARTAAFLAGIP